MKRESLNPKATKNLRGDLKRERSGSKVCPKIENYLKRLESLKEDQKQSCLRTEKIVPETRLDMPENRKNSRGNLKLERRPYRKQNECARRLETLLVGL